MTYKETLYALYKETKETTIFAMPSYEDAKIGIGFRRACCGSNLRDPVIDGISFMICADAFKTPDRFTPMRRPIKTTEELFYTPNNEVRITLRAVSFFPYTTIDLGDYRVLEMRIEEMENVEYRKAMPSRIRLDIERIS